MKKTFKFFFLIVIIFLFFAACDVYNTPLKEYIEYATSRAAADDDLKISPNGHKMTNGTIAISPSDEAKYTYITLDIDNPRKGSIKLEMEGEGSEYATAKLNEEGQAVITIKNQERGHEFDLSMNIYVNGRQMGEPKKIPKMQNRYFNNKLISLDIRHSAGFTDSYNTNYNPHDKNYWVELISGKNTIQINANKHKYSSFKISGENGNLFTVDNDITIIPIVVTADCGIEENYTLTVYKDEKAPIITVINKNNGFTYYCNSLSEAYAYIGDMKNAEIKVYKDIFNINGEDLFNITSATKKEISLLSDMNFTMSLGSTGSMFTINKNITFKAGGGKGTLTLSGGELGFNNSALINVNEGTFELYDGAEIYKNGNNAGPGNGGGVYVTNGILNMYGGSIVKNFANTSIEVAYGSGVYVTNGTFNMYGGSIAGNITFSSNNNSYGGGVAVIDSTFNMDGGNIGGYGSNQRNLAMHGGGVYIENSIFNFTNGLIGNAKVEGMLTTVDMAGNYASQHGGGIFLNGGEFNFTGQGLVAGNWVDNGGGGLRGGGLYINSGTYNGPEPTDTNYYKYNYPDNAGPF